MTKYPPPFHTHASIHPSINLYHHHQQQCLYQAYARITGFRPSSTSSAVGCGWFQNILLPQQQYAYYIKRALNSRLLLLRGHNLTWAPTTSSVVGWVQNIIPPSSRSHLHDYSMTTTIDYDYYLHNTSSSCVTHYFTIVGQKKRLLFVLLERCRCPIKAPILCTMIIACSYIRSQ